MFGAKKEETEEAESNEDLEEEENEGIAPTPRMNVNTIHNINPCRTGIDFRRQIMTSIDVRF